MTLQTNLSPSATKQQQFMFTMPVVPPINSDDGTDYPSDIRRRETIQQKFTRFHSRNPHVYKAIIDICNGLKQSGINSFGMKGIFERMRWEYAIQTQGEPYKLNNNYTALYARMIMECEAGLRGFFETRERLTE